MAGAVGVGFMDVIKDLGLKEPYVGQCVLQTSEIAEDLTYYLQRVSRFRPASDSVC